MPTMNDETMEQRYSRETAGDSARLEAALAAKDAEIERLTKANDLLTHQVITCGVAARHPDANLSRTGAYASKWNSQQAEDVRELRDDRDRLRAELAQAKQTFDLAYDALRRGFYDEAMMHCGAGHAAIKGEA